jgi:tRNA-binding EMAP/Myf-like protein
VEVELAESQPRQIASKLRAHYTASELTGRRVLVLCNLKARALQGFQSNGLLLCADGGGKAELVEPPASAPAGEVVSCGGLTGEPLPPSVVERSKVQEAVQRELKTDAKRVTVWRRHALTTTQGPCTVASLASAPVVIAWW